jgi:hypothetical protein
VKDAIPRPSWRSRILARRKDVPSLQTYSDHSIDKRARFGTMDREAPTSPTVQQKELTKRRLYVGQAAIHPSAGSGGTPRAPAGLPGTG